MTKGRLATVLAIGLTFAVCGSGTARAETAGTSVPGMSVPGTSVPGTSVPGTSVRSGDHFGYGRIVFDTKSQAQYELDRDGDHVTVRFTTPINLGAPPRPPRNVTDIRTAGATADLTLLHGATLRPARMDGWVVLDVLDPSDGAHPQPRAELPAVKPTTAPTRRESALAQSAELGGRPGAAAEKAAAAQAVLPVAPAPTAAADRPPVVAASLPPAGDPVLVDVVRPAPPGRDAMPENAGPVGLVARRIRLPPGAEGSAFLVSFSPTTGAAAFRTAHDTLLVFDERRPVDMAALREDPIFRSAAVQLLPAGTLFHVPLPAGLVLAVTQVPAGWRIGALPAGLKAQPIVPTQAGGRLNLAADQSSEVLSMADPDTGATLLIGTQRRSGQAIAIQRGTAEFTLRPTILGVVVEPLADTIAMKRVAAGFSLGKDNGPLFMSPDSSLIAATIDAAHLTRRLDFSVMRPDALVRRLSRQIADAAAAVPMARGLKHHAAAETMLALGMAAEAGSLLHVAAEQDPKEAASPDTAALTAIAALLAGRPREAEALDDPRLTGTDEIALWRAVRQAMRDDGSAAAASVFAATAPLALLYPSPMTDHILPLMVETMLQGGQPAAAARLLDQRKADPKLAYARALRSQAEGDPDKALEMLDELADGHDQSDRTRAAARAVEIRLAGGKLDKTQAADALEKLTYAWRGDTRELAVRQRVAELRAQTGAWRVALSGLRQAETDFPERAAELHAKLKDMFGSMIRSPDATKIAPMEFVAAVDENADLVPSGGDETGVDQPLSDRLLALDLPERAKPVLRKLLGSAATEVAKARFGASLATLQAHEKNDAGALATLVGSDARELPADLTEQRDLIRAGALGRTGETAAAAAILRKLGTPAAAAGRAQLHEDAKDWKAATQAWADAVALTVPDSGPLNTTQIRTLLRLATATAHVGDDAAVSALRTKYAERVGATSLGDMFRLLTAEPIRGTQDIVRSKQEVNLAASLPAGFKALQVNAEAR